MYNNKMKSYQKLSETYEGRWRQAERDNNVGEMYVASAEYKKNIEAQEKELKNMDPNSPEYEKAQHSLDEQRACAFEMTRAQRTHAQGEGKNDVYKQIEAENAKLSNEMGKAVERGDAKNYEQLRSKYEKNINAQDELGKEMRADGVQYRDTSYQNRREIYDRDTDMAQKLGERIAEKEAQGKKVSDEERAAFAKCKEQQEKDERNNLKYNEEKSSELKEERDAEEKRKNQQQIRRGY